jgi:branched-chain amino acid transport system substrate-binding protein
MVAYAHMPTCPVNRCQIVQDFLKKFNDDMYTGPSTTASMLAGSVCAKAKSTDPVKVAAVMEGMKFKSFNGEVTMRKTDHQLQQSCS